jgi:hypothetical protein
MLYRALADATLVIHLSFVLFVVLGGLLVLRWRWLAWLHLPAALWGAFIELTGRICPLTPLEQRFRLLGGEEGYEGGFIDHYITAWIYPEGLTRGSQIALGIGVLLTNAALYGWMIYRTLRERDESDVSDVGKT